ncbi:GNAT family N-acetyltransferase [Corticibacter populi]|uniref:GNAT family N-acetyltransferase n=1 Tax=Corticibacter populi TaxID=1550736 RepID=UPI0013C33339|nr:GNAT family N-acetyltransferase [Corticibacter populi]
MPDILGIQAQCYHSIQPESSASMEAKLKASPRTCFMARGPSGEALGYLLALPWMANQLPELDASHCHLPETPDCLYLHDLAIAPRARGSGTASLLIRHFLQSLAESTLPVARLIAIQQSAPFWQRHAFRPVEPTGALREKIRSYGDDAQLMERRRKPA